MNLSRIGLICHENEGKEILWYLAGLLEDYDYTSRLYESAAQAATDEKREEYKIYFIEEELLNERVMRFFLGLDHLPYLFVLSDGNFKEEHSRLISLNKEQLKVSLQKKKDLIRSILSQDEKYVLKIQRTQLIFPFQDIYYLEKRDKQICFHTKAGNYAKRLSMNSLLDEFIEHGFLHVHSSFLVNRRMITAIEKDQLEINHKEWIPVSRSKKRILENL